MPLKHTKNEVQYYLDNPKGKNVYLDQPIRILGPIYGQRVFRVKWFAKSLRVQLADSSWHIVKDTDILDHR